MRRTPIKVRNNSVHPIRVGKKVPVRQMNGCKMDALRLLLDAAIVIIAYT